MKIETTHFCRIDYFDRFVHVDILPKFSFVYTKRNNRERYNEPPQLIIMFEWLLWGFHVIIK
jgi:hypothetical protein